MKKSSMKQWRIAVAGIAALGLVLGTAGCATKKYVEQQVGASEERVGQRVDEVEGQVEANQVRLDEHDEALAEASKTAQDAYERAVAAGKLAEGKFLYETTFTEDQIRFEFDEAKLSGDAAAALDAFAEKVKAENKNVYIEVQGHTDAIGDEDYNEELGLRRAEAVRRYLSSNHGFPLHRISVISYGESEPVADNSRRDIRGQNRRVVIVVLQ